MADKVRDTADYFVGIPYKLGSLNPNEGLDCATFVLKFFEKYDNIPLGIEIDEDAFEKYKRDSKAYDKYIRQYLDLTKYPCALQPLDILVLKTESTVGEHVAIYLGNNIIIHCSSKYGVQLHKLSLNIKQVLFVGRFKDGIRHG